MVNSILKYIEPQLKAYMQFLNRVDSPVFRISTGEMIKGNGQEKEVVSINDQSGNALYIRQTQPETINERKALSSCDKEYNRSARCKVVFYTFGGNDFTVSPDKVASRIVNTLSRLNFTYYTGSASEIAIDVNGTSLDIEKIYTEETGKTFEGGTWPTLVAVEFTLNYVDTNCDICDIDENETVVTWTPNLTPENCETKAICEAVAGCQVVKDLQSETASLQEQIDNLPTTVGVESVSGNQVNNSDPLNPIIEPLGLIKVIDKQGDFFTDLASASTWINQYFSDPTIITNKSFDNNILFFTVPNFTVMDLADGFLNNSTASFIDELGLISEFTGGSIFIWNSSKHIFGNILFNVVEAFTGSDLKVQLIDFDMDANCAFANDSTGTFKITGNIGASANSSGFFYNSNTTILTNSFLYTNNGGGIDASLEQAILNGCNVFFDGIDKENIKNKALNFTVLDNEKYPTTQATKDLVDYYIQSNIKIIGDWDATSGSYPLADESNTTPFIVQWGATIKAGWAFRVGYGQAGTVGGFDYENGDVVYALVDSPTNSSTDWGDLDHNLQQANESIRGTAKIVTAAIIADETSTDDERIVTTKKLWQNFWTRVLSIAHTFAAKITFTTAPRFSSTTASQYLKVDASKDLISVSSIPATDITEDSTHRFVTDTDKTTWNGKADAQIINDISNTSVITGWSSFTIKQIIEIIDGDKVTVFFYISGVSNNSTTKFEVTNTSNPLIDAYYAPTQSINNGVTASTAPARCAINASSNEVLFWTSWGGASYNASGNKSVRGTITYYK